MFLSRLLTAIILSASLSVAAQTYTPKEIHLEGVPETDVPGLLKIVNLQPGTDITKQQIEDALQRLGDTGLFSNIQYTVNAKVLTIQLSTAASAKPLPVRFGNFVWWQPAELEKLVEARVPVYRGELPINGTLMAQVQAALIELLKEKGIDAHTTASEVTERGAVVGTAIYITTPVIQLGALHLQSADPALQAKIDQRVHTLGEEDFDVAVTSNAIQQYVADVYQNAGYLDIATDAPTFGPPHKDPKVTVEDHYLVDASTTVHPGEVYRVATLSFPVAPPLSENEIASASGIKAGDVASALNLRVATDAIQRAFGDRGYLDAAVSSKTAKDAAHHTAAYSFSIAPGEIYYFASVDTSTLTPAQQETFSHTFRAAPGVVADKALRDRITLAREQMGILKTTVFGIVPNRAKHSVTFVIKPAGH